MSSVADGAAEVLMEARRTGRTIAALPESLRPDSLASAYAIQDALHEVAGWSLAVHKVGATNDGAQALLGCEEPFGGRIPADRIESSGVVLKRSDFHHVPRLECEFALRLGRDVGPGNLDDLASAVDAVIPAIEVVDSRFDDQMGAGALNLIADNAIGAAVVLGDPADIDPLTLAERAARLVIGGEEVAAGTGSAVLGDPFHSFTWAMNHEIARGRTIPAGTVVITGSCTGAPPAVLDTDVVADFGPLGTVEVRIEDS